MDFKQFLLPFFELDHVIHSVNHVIHSVNDFVLTNFFNNNFIFQFNCLFLFCS